MPEEKASILREQYKIMSKRLWYIITWPAMILTSVFGFGMLYLGWDYLNKGYMHVKLSLVALLYIYHFLCGSIFRQLQKNVIRFSSSQLRIWNEIATLLLVGIVFIIVRKEVNFYGIFGFIGVGLILFAGIKLYKILRKQ